MMAWFAWWGNIEGAVLGVRFFLTTCRNVSSGLEGPCEAGRE